MVVAKMPVGAMEVNLKVRAGYGPQNFELEETV